MPDASGNLLPSDPGYVAPPTGGLINSPTVTAPPVQAVATTAAPTPFTVAPEATVASNIEKIVAADSPLMAQAASRAAQQVNARGLLNSSIGISAGQSALYDAALPIAQQDAQTHNQAATNTAAAKNTASLQNAQLLTGTAQFNANATNTRDLQTNENAIRVQLQEIQSNTQLTAVDKQVKAQAAISAADNVARDAIARLQASTSLTQQEKQIQANEILSLRDDATKKSMQTFQFAADKEKIALDGTIRQSLADTEAGYKTLMQTSAGAADLYKQSIANFAAIIANKDIADKTGALNSGVKQLNDALKMLGDINGLDLGSYLDFSAAGAPSVPASTEGAVKTQEAPTAPVAPTYVEGSGEGGGGGGDGGGF